MASHESDGLVVRVIHGGLQFLVGSHHPFFHSIRVNGFVGVNCLVFISWQIITKLFGFPSPPLFLFAICCLARFLVEGVLFGCGFVVRHVLRILFSMRSRTSLGSSFESDGMIFLVNTANMTNAEALAVFETSSTSH